MAFKDKLVKKLNAHRLQQSVKATVQSNGRLTFTVEATKEMQLSESKSLVIFEAEGGDLGAIIGAKGDPDAFALKRCGQYFYIAFKQYLQEQGIDYKAQRIIYDITETNEQVEERTLYKFERRVLPKTPEQLPLSADGEGNGDGSGNGAGSGSGAGNGDGSGGEEKTDDDMPQFAQETASERFEEEVVVTTPPPPPRRPTRPAPPPPQREETNPFDESVTTTSDDDDFPF